MLREIVPNIWAIETPFHNVGIEFGARMIVVRRKNGELFVYAPFAISDEDEISIREKGEVRDIVAPNIAHYLEIGEFARRFPSATVWALPEIDKKLGDVPHQHLEYALDSWSDDFESLLVDGMLAFREWVFLHKESRTLIITDLSFHLPPPRTPLERIASSLDGVPRRFGTTLFFRHLVRLGDKSRVRENIREILRWDFERIIPAHGYIVEDKAKQKLRTAYSFLKV